jgi:hypothetical protein
VTAYIWLAAWASKIQLQYNKYLAMNIDIDNYALPPCNFCYQKLYSFIDFDWFVTIDLGMLRLSAFLQIWRFMVGSHGSLCQELTGNCFICLSMTDIGSEKDIGSKRWKI